MIPDWMPNIHPFIVHFPIALLLLAIVIDAACLMIREKGWLDKTVLLLYSTGTVGLMAAYITGQQAVDTVMVAGEAVPVVTGHEEWALYTTIFFMAFTILRWIGFRKGWMGKHQVRFGITIPVLAGAALLWYTGEQGARLVYEHGVAVGAVDQLQQKVEQLESEIAGYRETALPVLRDDGSWAWRAVPGAEHTFLDAFSLESNRLLQVKTGRENGTAYLSILPEEEISFLLFGGLFRSVDGTMEVRVDDFKGRIKLIHHFLDPSHYQYLAFDSSKIVQGRVENGTDTILQQEEITGAGWHTLRVTADGRHFYGYLNGRTVTHTHADEMNPGFTGVAVMGEGEVRIRHLAFQDPSIN